ncbi:unnamed protein product, partial [Candidula unifasciata]
GKFAVVRRCLDNQTGEEVAAKIIRKRRKGKSCREEILREVVMLEFAMAHPRLVSLREVFETQSELILVTEYCSGGELFDECVIKESFKEDDVRRLLAQILEGLAFLHDNNIVHLDLKPQNILLTKPFPEGEVKICDLGFACLTNTGEDIRDIIGTPDYVAPEVLDYEPLNIQTDMWSLGVLTYVMLTACSPFAGDTQQETFCNITQVKLDFPEDLFGHINPLAKDFISKLLVKRARDRMTARQCFDHPWLKDLQNTMSLNVPVSDHSEELAHDMVIPSNWHMSPDRRSSISNTDCLSTDNSSRVDGHSLSLPDVSLSHKEKALGCLSEDKDSISKTLSHIDIDRRSLDRSSTASFETCPECVDNGLGSDAIQLECGFTTDTSGKAMISSSTSGDTVSGFASELAHSVTAARSEDGSDSLQEEHTVLGFSAAVSSHEGLNDFCPSTLEASETDFQPNHSAPVASTISEVPTHRDSSKQTYSKNRMSMEIPPKKAKCIVQGEEIAEGAKADNLQSATVFINSEHTSESSEQCKDQPGQECNGTEEFRNAV